MSEVVLWSIHWLVATVVIMWRLPNVARQDFVALSSCVFWFSMSPLASAAVLSSIILVYLSMRYLHAWAYVVALLLIVITVAMFVGLRIYRVEFSAAATLGISYFCLRQIHVIVDWRLKRIDTPSFRELLWYHYYLPAIAAGPIHRFQAFQRQCQRRRYDDADIASGAERVLYGLVKVALIGDFCYSKLGSWLGIPPDLSGVDLSFSKLWFVSALGWLKLYVQFSGLTDVALGFSRMMGITLEENFCRPWQARNLLEFWSRWHITLSEWCRDYVHAPLAAWSRSRLLGLCAAMLVIGLWHEFSVYYVMWAGYQAIGIILVRFVVRIPIIKNYKQLPERLRSLLTPVLILAWLSAARPVLNVVLDYKL